MTRNEGRANEHSKAFDIFFQNVEMHGRRKSSGVLQTFSTVLG